MKERRKEAGVGHSVWCHLDMLLFALVPCVHGPLLTPPQPSEARMVSPFQRVPRPGQRWARMSLCYRWTLKLRVYSIYSQSLTSPPDHWN